MVIYSFGDSWGGGVLACVGWCMLVGVFVDWLVICVGWLLYLLIGC